MRCSKTGAGAGQVNGVRILLQATTPPFGPDQDTEVFSPLCETGGESNKDVCNNAWLSTIAPPCTATTTNLLFQTTEF